MGCYVFLSGGPYFTDRTDTDRTGRIFFGLSSDLEFFLNKIFFPIIKINRLPSKLKLLHVISTWPDGSACPLGSSFWLSSWLLCYWSVHESTFDNPADDTHVSIYISCEIVVWLTVSLIL